MIRRLLPSLSGASMLASQCPRLNFQIYSKNIRSISSTVSVKAKSSTASMASEKREGDISSVFLSLSGVEPPPLPSRIASQKSRLIAGHEAEITTSWRELLGTLQEEVSLIAQKGSDVVPTIRFEDIKTGEISDGFRREFKKRGVCVVKGVINEKRALDLKADLKEYLKLNPATKSFPPRNPSVFELYFSPSQMAARSDPNLLETSKFLMSFWHSKDDEAPISTAHPTSYADRLRIRLPGDTGFTLGPHVDSGSVERWEDNGYGLGNIFCKIWSGQWDQYDPWEASSRLPVKSDLYNGAGACSMFRMFQGWLSLSNTKPGEGTLLVNLLLGKATAYFLLRPFFRAKRPYSSGLTKREYLDPDNWTLEEEPSSKLQGAACGQCQELNDELHPHLELSNSMVHVPEVRPGDFVAWHCDTIHSVDKTHAGHSDSSVMYIPVVPLTEPNARYLVRQREAFQAGFPGPDFPGGIGESLHRGRLTEEQFKAMADRLGQQAMGFRQWDEDNLDNFSEGQKLAVRSANKILGFT